RLQKNLFQFIVLQSSAPESMALSAGTWCNLIDVGQGVPLPEIEELVTVLASPLSVHQTSQFLTSLHKADTLLVLGDNAGETVMDKLFLDLTSFEGRKYYMTREHPVMNDATLKDAEMAGLNEVADLISSGIDVPGIIPDMLRGKAREIYESADIILAKGQGNLEALFGINDPRVYHSFVVKCPVVSRATGIALGSGVFSRFTNAGGKNANL
ncbi:MAG: ARMT1-like domain-containing protein, partial [Candidatus Fermentibacteria bacterium]|nr:ARMT1-like domain-containing protein [Candidatus Fermentibacteria bacterium]